MAEQSPEWRRIKSLPVIFAMSEDGTPVFWVLIGFLRPRDDRMSPLRQDGGEPGNEFAPRFGDLIIFEPQPRQMSHRDLSEKS